jgi:iron-sulfur cluster assembly accessory protein
MLTARGVLTKINSVLIPGINDEHLFEVNREVKKRGAFLHNIMPLISEAEHGTVFGLTGQRGPSAQELKAVQDACMGGANLMRHCRQCRADAVGLLGEDRSDEFTLDKIDAMDVVYDLDKRRAYQQQVEVERQAQHQAKLDALAARPASGRPGRRHERAGGGGHRRPGQGQPALRPRHRIPDLRGVRTSAQFVGHRRVDLYCQGGYGEDEQLPSIVGAINDCHAVLVSKIGACPRDELQAAGIEPVDAYAHEFIEKAALAWFADYRRAWRAASWSAPAARRRPHPPGRLHRRGRRRLIDPPPQGDPHGPEDHRLDVHRLLGLRARMPQRRHPREGRHLHHRRGQVHRVRRPLRRAAVHRGVPGRRLHQEGLSMHTPQVTVTPAAEKFMRRMVRFSDRPNGGFRLSVTPGGCSGYTSEFTVEAMPLGGDAELQVGELRLFLPATSRLLLDGVTVDFADTPTQSGLTFFNPNAEACGCSTADTPARQRRPRCRCRRSSAGRPEPPRPAMDADFDTAVLGLALPPAVEQALAEAAATRADPVRATAALMRAQQLAPEHPAVLIAFYRHHFYGHRLRLARDVARRVLAVGAQALGLPTAWREVPRQALPGARHEARTRFYLFGLKGYAYLSLRLDDPVEARDALALLRALDPDDCVGGALLEAVRQRAGRDEADDRPAEAHASGAAAWARLAVAG